MLNCMLIEETLYSLQLLIFKFSFLCFYCPLVEALWYMKKTTKKKNYELKEKPRSEKPHRNSCHELNYYYFLLSFPFQSLKLFDLVSEICKFSTVVPSRLFLLENFQLYRSWTLRPLSGEKICNAINNVIKRMIQVFHKKKLLALSIHRWEFFAVIDEVNSAQFTSIKAHFQNLIFIFRVQTGKEGIGDNRSETQINIREVKTLLHSTRTPHFYCLSNKFIQMLWRIKALYSASSMALRLQNN